MKKGYAITILIIVLYIISYTGLTGVFYNTKNTNMQPNSYREYINQKYGNNVNCQINNYQRHAKTAAVASTRVNFIIQCIAQRLLPTFAKIKLNPQSRREAYNIYRAQINYMHTCLSEQKSILNRNINLRNKKLDIIKNILQPDDLHHLRTMTINICNSMWKSANQNLNKKLNILRQRDQHTYNILNRHPKNNTADQKYKATILEKIKQYTPYTDPCVNNPKFRNMTNLTTQQPR